MVWVGGNFSKPLLQIVFLLFKLKRLTKVRRMGLTRPTPRVSLDLIVFLAVQRRVVKTVNCLTCLSTLFREHTVQPLPVDVGDVRLDADARILVPASYFTCGYFRVQGFTLRPVF